MDKVVSRDLETERSFYDYRWLNTSKQLTELEQKRIEITVSLIPQDAQTILDVGCGDGRITNVLCRKYKVIGLDHSMSSLKGVHGTLTCASSTDIPFLDDSFDLVLCSEVLEHLPDEVYESTLKELERVAKKYILISVPYRENMRSRTTKCYKCRAKFHIWLHHRAFKRKQIKKMFSNFSLRIFKLFGKRDPYTSRFVLFLNQYLGGRWLSFEEGTICPSCGNTKSPQKRRTVVTIFCGLINLLCEKLIPRLNNNWIIALYSKKEHKKQNQ